MEVFFILRGNAGRIDILLIDDSSIITVIEQYAHSGLQTVGRRFHSPVSLVRYVVGEWDRRMRWVLLI